MLCFFPLVLFYLTWGSSGFPLARRRGRLVRSGPRVGPWRTASTDFGIRLLPSVLWSTRSPSSVPFCYHK
ncbi:hypothetical protein TcWFU_010472 [Taenia crassiceps]|uniref:Secreted protein n=1 Tax=Taenia crassiceps TaxID=6207 RepID=A0ABR4QPT0_9CEST